MSIKETQNPLSIANRVRDRLEKRADGTEPSSYINHDILPSRTLEQPLLADPRQEQMSEQFLGLLMGNDPTEFQVHSGSENDVGDHRDERIGTNPFFSSLNGQEKTFAKDEQARKPFSMVIENSSLGPIQIKGNWEGSMLRVSLKTSNNLSLNEQKVLCAMLSKGLSSKLGVQLELTID